MKTADQLREYKRDWARKDRGTKPRTERPCAICETVFLPPVHHPEAQTCSRPCSRKLEYRNHKNSYFDRALAFAKNNSDKCREYQRISRAKNPELYRAISRNKQNRRRSYSIGGDFTAAQWLEVVVSQNDCCWWCGVECKLTIDHVIPVIRGGAHTRSNIVGACQSCNSKKRDKLWPLSQGELYKTGGLLAVWTAVEASLPAEAEGASA